jgi:hypothetical protein
VPKGPSAAPLGEAVAALPGGGTMGVTVPLQPPPLSSVAQMAATGKSPGGTNSEGTPDSSAESRSPGLAQEERVRTHLRYEGYTEPYGADDTEIARQLGIGKTGDRADIVMQHGETGRWLVAESKGGNMGKAVKQIENTANALRNEGVALDEMDFSVYTNEMQYEKLQQPPDGVGGYLMNDEGYLGWFNYADDGTVEAWQYAEVNNKRIRVHKAQ